MTITVPARPADGGRSDRRPWGRALLWLAGLGIFFYSSYGLANYLADQRVFVPSIVFGWEHGMPFLAWTIIPYWSVNLFYAASLFVCTSRTELDTLGRRLLTAQVIAVACFLFFPLRFSFAKPEIGGGLSGFMFDALLSFDKPYNQAPSLHIALLVILWVHYASHQPAWARWLLHPWFALIGLSVLTTYQHHFFDIPTGALLGLFCLWLWPDEMGVPSPPPGEVRKRRKLAAYYGLGALALVVIGIGVGGWGLWLCYPAASLALVAANYLWRGAAGFQKRGDGSMPLAVRLLFAPYQLGAFLNSRWWTRRQPSAGEDTRDSHAASRTRGSSQRIATSAANDNRISTAPSHKVSPMITGTSRFAIAETKVDPKPGIANMISTTKEPDSKLIAMCGAAASVGLNPAINACRSKS